MNLMNFILETINNFNPNFSLWKLFLKYLILLKTLQVTDKLKYKPAWWWQFLVCSIIKLIISCFLNVVKCILLTYYFNFCFLGWE